MTITCADCGRAAPNDGRGLCHTCRVRLSRQGTVAQHPRRYAHTADPHRAKRWRWTNARRIRLCKACGLSVMRGSTPAAGWNTAYCLICKTEQLFNKGGIPWQPKFNSP